MSGIIKTIKAKDDNNVEQNIFPKTVLEAVVDAETNETLDVILDNLNEKIDNIEVSGEGIDEVNTYLQRKPCKNLLEVTVMSGSTAGVTHTVNEDKSISTSGVGTTNYASFTIGEAYLKANTEYILSGCPKTDQPTNYNINVYYKGRIVATDNGDSVTFTVSSDGNYSITMPIIPSVNYDGLVYYPMVRLATVEDDTYEPYYQDAMSIVNNALVHGDVVDNLLSTATDLPLSANQGRVINEKLTPQGFGHTGTSDFMYVKKNNRFVMNGLIIYERLVEPNETVTLKVLDESARPLFSHAIFVGLLGKDNETTGVSMGSLHTNGELVVRNTLNIPVRHFYFDAVWDV